MKVNIRLMVAIAALVFASLACQALQPGSAAIPAIPTAFVVPAAPSAPTVAPVVVSAQRLSQQDTLTALYQNVSPGIPYLFHQHDPNGWNRPSAHDHHDRKPGKHRWRKTE